MIELRDDELIFSFPDVHEDAVCRIHFQRTLRIPDDKRHYPLPPGLGRFPMEHVEDHALRLPDSWSDLGGVLLPIYQSEAMWINFSHGSWYQNNQNRYPFAIKIAAGKINALTGGEWNNALDRAPQDYVVSPGQPWLDGFCVEQGLVRQFVATPLGLGHTAEEQLTGKAEFGGLQIIAYPTKRESYLTLLRARSQDPVIDPLDMPCFLRAPAMGLAPGGLMEQEIYEDEFGFDAWDQTVHSRCFVHMLNSLQWEAATGKPVPGTPAGTFEYNNARLPWFTYYNDQLKLLPGSPQLAKLRSLTAVARGAFKWARDKTINIFSADIVPLGTRPGRTASDSMAGGTSNQDA